LIAGHERRARFARRREPREPGEASDATHSRVAAAGQAPGAAFAPGCRTSRKRARTHRARKLYGCTPRSVVTTRRHHPPFIPDTRAIESSSASVRLRTRLMKGAGSKTTVLPMVYRLLASAQQRWRRFNGHELVVDVLAVVRVKDGIKVTDDDDHDDGLTDERVDG
jgi:hypothetical protein